MWSVCHVLFGSEAHFRLTAFSILLIQSAFLKVSLTFVNFFDFLDTYHRMMELFSDISVAVLYILFTVSWIYPHFVFNCPRKNPMVRGADTAESWTQLSPHTLPSNWSLLELIFVFKPTLVVCYKPLHSLIWLSRVHLMWFCLYIQTWAYFIMGVRGEDVDGIEYFRTCHLHEEGRLSVYMSESCKYSFL